MWLQPAPRKLERMEGLDQGSSVLPRTEKLLAVWSTQLRWVAADLQVPVS